MKWFALVLFGALLAGCGQPRLTPSGAITITTSNQTIENKQVTNPNGDCIVVTNASNIVIRASEIGPCKGNAIRISGGGTIDIHDNYIHPEGTLAGCCDKTDGIYAVNVDGLNIRGNVIAFGEANTHLQRSRNVVWSGNFGLNPRNAGNRGQHFQCYDHCDGVTVEGNYTLASKDAKYKFPANQEDAINIIGGPNGATANTVVRSNYVQGGFSGSGCGIISDASTANYGILENVLIDTGQCGIGIAGGNNVTSDNNKVYNTKPIQGGGNSGLYVWNMYNSSCSGIFVRTNIVWAQTTSGAPNSYWNGGGCGNLQSSGNRGGEDAKAALTAPGGLPPAPMIPPGPVNCVAISPWTTQTSKARCDGSAPIPPDPIPPDNPILVSDQFNAAVGPWAFVGPAGASYAINGTQAQLTVPGGSVHAPWSDGTNSTARLMQRVSDGDYTITVKFDTVPARNMEIEGVLFEQDSRNFLRFEMRSDGSTLTISAAGVIDGGEKSYAQIPATRAVPAWLRIQRRGASWTLAASLDGATFQSAPAFTHAMVARRVGMYAGNYQSPASAAPAYTALVDSFVSQ